MEAKWFWGPLHSQTTSCVLTCVFWPHQRHRQRGIQCLVSRETPLSCRFYDFILKLLWLEFFPTRMAISVSNSVVSSLDDLNNHSPRNWSSNPCLAFICSPKIADIINGQPVSTTTCRFLPNRLHVARRMPALWIGQHRRMLAGWTSCFLLKQSNAWAQNSKLSSSKWRNSSESCGHSWWGVDPFQWLRFGSIKQSALTEDVSWFS